MVRACSMTLYKLFAILYQYSQAIFAQFKCASPTIIISCGFFCARMATGHTGPVYKIKCHPLNPDVFLSCSADWTVKLWSTNTQRKDDSQLTFHQMDLEEVVHDVEWAPHNANLFASVTSDGRIEVCSVFVTLNAVKTVLTI